MSNIDKHAVQAVADLKAGYTLGHADVAILNELARIALASLEAEAVAYMYKDNLHADARFSLHTRFGNWSQEDINEYEITEIPLYTAPPVPVSVPDEVNVLLNHLEDVLPDDAFNLIDVKTWNNVSMLSRPDVYRSAMLHGAEPVTTAYKLPEGWVAVPVEPTEEMIAAAMCSNDVLFDKEDDTLFRVQHGEIWRAMLSTAPQQEVKP
ncbi:hypothetical protein [Enterobacter hormaechei]|uniref:hypothetical protein n=1 Tax=Enterobacter hormaechei TaxID=158836 RepID=UPI00079477E9|nr:hypothetical protein [Enterobacter hormaechei]SAD34744.1 Uncharacterised protein [Enterobacter hormaechei]